MNDFCNNIYIWTTAAIFIFIRKMEREKEKKGEKCLYEIINNSNFFFVCSEKNNINRF